MIISIVSGYFNPLHYGHICLIENAKKYSDKLIVIVNNDKQQVLKKGKIIMNEEERMIVVRALRAADEVILAVDSDRTVIESLRMIAEKYPNDKLIFCNGGDRNTTFDIPETEVCEKYNIELKFGVGADFKQDSSSRINSLIGKE
jgi:cytidyltransferase-like protein